MALREQEIVVVQTAATLPATDAGWTTQTWLRFDGGSDGCGSEIGSATLIEHFGNRIAPSATSVQRIGIAPDIADAGTAVTLIGSVVRLCRRNADATLSAFWWGVITGQAVAVDGADNAQHGGQAAWQAIGLAGTLDQFALTEGRCLSGVSPATDPVVDLYYLPVFNGIAGIDRSSITRSIGAASVYVHDLTNDRSDGNSDGPWYWTARQVLDHILALVSLRGWRWSVSDPDGNLSFQVQALDLNEQTAFAAIQAIIDQRRGLLWWVSVSADVAVINVISTVRTVNVSYGIGLVANSDQHHLSTIGDPFVTGLRYEIDASSSYDEIQVRGARPWIALTLKYGTTGSADLQKGWSSAAETAWDSEQDASLTEMVWRRYEINPAWQGLAYEGGMRNHLETADDQNHGTAGFNGARTVVAVPAGEPAPPAFSLTAERDLPCSPGFSRLRIGPRQPPVVIVGTAAAGYDDISQSSTVTIESSPPAVVIDQGDNGAGLAGDLASGLNLLVTLSLRESAPLIVSWVRPASFAPRAQRRRKVITLPNCEQWVVASTAVPGVNAITGALLTAGGGGAVGDGFGVIRDDMPTMRAALALARGFYSSDSVRVTWTDRGSLGIDIGSGTLFRLGSMVTTVDRGDILVPADSVVVRRDYRRQSLRGAQGVEVPMWTTTYQTAVIRPDLEVVL